MATNYLWTIFVSGAYEKLFYRTDRHCHFLNWLVVTDVKGFIADLDSWDI